MSTDTALDTREREALTQLSSDILERLVIEGDLARLTPAQRLEFYDYRCRSLGLDPGSKPFDYIVLNNKLTLYLNRTGGEQLRRRHGITVRKVGEHTIDDPRHETLKYLIYEVEATDANGRTEFEIAGVALFGTGRDGTPYPLTGDRLTNRIMALATKAKRRATISITGAGALDETEVATIEEATPIVVDHKTGEIVDAIEPTTTNEERPERHDHATQEDPPTPTPEGEATPATWSEFWTWARSTEWVGPSAAEVERRHGFNPTLTTPAEAYQYLMEQHEGPESA